MPTDSAIWKSRLLGGLGGYTASLSYKLNGDTLVNGFNYSKVYENNYLFGMMREEEKVVYFKPNPEYVNYLFFECDSSEFVLYDFNLEIGDTFYTASCTEFGPADSTYFTKILDVDSIQINDGSFRKRYLLSEISWMLPYGLCGLFEWVEGVGNVSFDPFYFHVDCFESASYFTCLKIGENEIYRNCAADSNKEIETINFKIIPNPTFNKVYIEGLNAYSDYTITIYNLKGTAILGNLHNQASIDLSSFDRGIYYCLIQTAQFQIVKKLVKL
jgi:hypothetical protein